MKVINAGACVWLSLVSGTWYKCKLAWTDCDELTLARPSFKAVHGKTKLDAVKQMQTKVAATVPSH